MSLPSINPRCPVHGVRHARPMCRREDEPASSRCDGSEHMIAPDCAEIGVPHPPHDVVNWPEQTTLTAAATQPAGDEREAGK